MWDLIFEIIIEIIIEGGEEICSNKKISKWIRYPILFIFILISLVLILGSMIIGIILLKTNILGGVLFIGIGLFVLFAYIYKFRKTYIIKKNED